MTQTVLEKPTTPPAYDTTSSFSETAEKPDHCPHHGASATPNIDKHLRQFGVNARLQALVPVGTALDGESCTRCTVEAVTNILSSYVKDVKAAKKSGQLDKREAKAMKSEAKGLFKVIKKDLKASWKEKKAA